MTDMIGATTLERIAAASERSPEAVRQVVEDFEIEPDGWDEHGRALYAMPSIERIIVAMTRPDQLGDLDDG